MDKNAKEDKEEKKPIIVRNSVDLQRLKLEKLMANPDKPVVIPERPKERGVPAVPDFVRNVMGSSAGAGSGEFHVYRHLRRKEYARQKYMKERAERDRLDEEYHQKLEENKKKADELTAKKRLKRMKKKKQKKKNVKKQKLDQSSNKSESTSDDSDDEEAESDQKMEENSSENKANECANNKSDGQSDQDVTDCSEKPKVVNKEDGECSQHENDNSIDTDKT